MIDLLNLFGCKAQIENDPYWEFDKTKHFRPELNKGEFFKLSGYDFGWFVLEPMSKFVKNKAQEIERGKSLSYGQKALYYWWYLDAEVTNGGFVQFYYNGYGPYIPTIIKGLKHIGDTEMTNLVIKADKIYQKNKKLISKAQERDSFGSDLYDRLDQLSLLDDKYYELNEKTMSLIENYIRKHPNEICIDEDGNEFDLDFSGELKTYHSNKSVKEIIPLENGTVSGTFRSYFENGQLKDEIHYLNGEQTDIRTEYYENGNKKFSVTKSQNPKGNLHSHYYENGNLKSTEVYITKDDRDGKWIKYYPNGQMKSETEFVNKKFFVQNCWREDGTQILKDGTGLYINESTYWEGFTQRNEQEYLNYKRHGKQYTYNNDKLSLYQEMKEGKEHGITKTYDDEGNLKEEIVYENGVEKSRKNIKTK